MTDQDNQSVLDKNIIELRALYVQALAYEPTIRDEARARQLSIYREIGLAAVAKALRVKNFDAMPARAA